jgi:hypothetical protein
MIFSENSEGKLKLQRAKNILDRVSNLHSDAKVPRSDITLWIEV